jgi:hypothetical protein
MFLMVVTTNTKKTHALTNVFYRCPRILQIVLNIQGDSAGRSTLVPVLKKGQLSHVRSAATWAWLGFPSLMGNTCA